MSYPCVDCGKFAFPRGGVTCYWCRSDAGEQPKEPAAAPTADRLTIDQLRSRMSPRNQR